MITIILHIALVTFTAFLLTLAKPSKIVKGLFAFQVFLLLLQVAIVLIL